MNNLELARLHNRETVRCSSYDLTGRNTDYWILQPGETAVLAEIEGPGVLTHIWMTQRNHYRECLLKITWDDAPHPSVLVPLGDFFCLGNGIVNSFQSALFTASTNRNNRFNEGCALNCYAPMPFRKRARVELINESDEPHMQYFYVDYERGSLKDLSGLGYFHAEFRRTNPFGGWGPGVLVNSTLADVLNKERMAWDNNYVILETKGRGHYLGCNLSVSNFQGTWWGEGDDMIWVDGYKWPPDLHGTGSEDYFNQAWGMQPNAFLRNGSSIYEANTGGYQTSYVLHLDNPVRFRKEIKVTIEHGHGNHLGNEMSSVAYWYTAKPVGAVAPPAVAQRMPVANAQGRWAYDKRNQCPGRPVTLTDEMRRNLKCRNKERRFLEASPWRSGFVTAWRLSRLQPKRKDVSLAPCAKLSDDLGWEDRELASIPAWFANANPVFEHADGIAYFGNRFRVSRPGRWTLHLGHDGGAALFIDGQRVLCETRRVNPCSPSRSQVTVELTKGDHEIVVAFDTDKGMGWGIAFSFETPKPDRRGKPVLPVRVTQSAAS